MMREIKFKAWNKNTEIMSKDILHDMEKFYRYDDELTMWEVRYMMKNGYNEIFNFLEYTGFKDKNDKDIYEGDLLYHKIQGLRKVYYPFDERTASFGLLDIKTGMRSCLENPFLYEVVGNIYENPELLEVE